MKTRFWLTLPSSAVLGDTVLALVGIALLREPRTIVLGILAHGVMAFAFGFFLRRALREMGRAACGRIGALATATAFFIPVFGGAALMAAIYVIVSAKPKEQTISFQRYAPSNPFDRQPTRELRGAVLADRLLHLVRYGGSVEARFRAVLQTNDVPRGIAVQVLKTALADKAEEVRLLAFSQLEKIRRTIDLQIEHALEVLKEGPTPRRAWELHVTLAENYHEVAYLGLAEGELYKHVLKSALTHAREALAIVPDDAAVLRLVGRILLKQSPAGEPAVDAREVFDQAILAGIVQTELAVEGAEEAFRRRAFEEARNGLSTIDGLPTDHVLVAEIQELWR
ncbi:MAG: hypothetical protein FWD69_03820 [Polyangiaceae bacterium]|nr:hypothetical protein [Polyangiaceae bacterium]